MSVAVGEDARGGSRAVEEGAVGRSEIAHLPALPPEGELDVLARHLVIREDEVVLLVPPDPEPVVEGDRDGDLAGLAGERIEA